MTFLEAIGAGTVLFLAYERLGAAVAAARAWHRGRWCRSVGIPARDAVLRAMSKAGMPTCARPVSKRGRVVVVGVGFGPIRRYPVDTTSPETMMRDAHTAVEAERVGMRGD